MRVPKTLLRLASWLCVAILAAVVSAHGQRAQRGTTRMVRAVHEKCPHGWAGADSFPGNGQLSIAPHMTDVPEFHDCQRFIVGGRRPRYDSVFAIFAHEGLDKLDLPQSTVIPAFTPGSTSELLTSGPTTTVGAGTGRIQLTNMRTWAVIYAENDYPALGIQRYFNCLLIGRIAVGANMSYSAMMVPIGGRSDICAQRPESVVNYGVSTGRSNRLLTGVTLSAASGPMTDVPPVARWDWDRVNNVQFIGIKCPDGWCEFYGTGTFNPSPSYPGSSLGSLASVKGWYDEQSLAHFTGTPAHLAVAGREATVFPAPGLRNRDSWSSIMRGRWDTVAYVSMHDEDAAYAQKGGLHQSPQAPNIAPGNRNNVVSFCVESALAAGPASSCNTPSLPTLTTAACPSRQFAKVEYPGQPTRYFCVKYTVNPNGYTAKGVVRWRWRDTDETVWISCPDGCCEVEMKG